MTFNPPGFRTFMVIATGFALRWLSKVLERAGDFASDPGVRLFNHVTALAVLIGAGVCFIWALKMMFFDKPREQPAEAAAKAPPAPKTVDIYPERPADFDPDAALARYMQARQAPDPDTAPPVPRPGGFGRKGL